MNDIRQIRKGVEIRTMKTLRQAVDNFAPGDKIFSSKEDITAMVEKLYNQKLDKFRAYKVKVG